MNQVSYFLDLVLRGTFLVESQTFWSAWYVGAETWQSAKRLFCSTDLRIWISRGGNNDARDSGLKGREFPFRDRQQRGLVSQGGLEGRHSSGWRCHWVVGILHPHQLWTTGGVIWRSHTAKTYPRTSSSWNHSLPQSQPPGTRDGEGDEGSDGCILNKIISKLQ